MSWVRLSARWKSYLTLNRPNHSRPPPNQRACDRFLHDSYHPPSGAQLSPTWKTSPETFTTNEIMLNALSSWFGISISSLNNVLFPSLLRNQMPGIPPIRLSTWFIQNLSAILLRYPDWSNLAHTLHS